MSELERMIVAAREHVEVDWSEARERRVRRAIDDRRRWGLIARWGLVVAGTGAVVMLVIARAPGDAGGGSRASVDRFDDGSTALRLKEGTELHVRLDTPARTEVELVRGRARFDVVHREDRVFEVIAGPVQVEVLGTHFIVERVGEGARVTVTGGRVRVTAPWTTRVLAAGDSEELQPPPVSKPLDPDPPGPIPGDAAPLTSPSPAPAHSHRWQLLANKGDYARAYTALSKDGAGAVGDAPADLLLAADVARLSHHPREALGPLRAVVDRHRRDPRAPLAAFTLGRVLLDELADPAAAAAAFAEARALAPTGALAEDALAREVEAWSRAGDHVAAHRHAVAYVAHYPTGRRLREVRSFGALE